MKAGIGVIGDYLLDLSTSFTLISYRSKLLFMEMLKTSTIYAEMTQEYLFERSYCMLLEE